MPWKEAPVSEQRLVLVNLMAHGGRTVSAICRELGVSRKTAYKWLARWRAEPSAALTDRPRRPRNSPRQTAAPLEARVLEVRDRYGWGARKVWAYLRNQGQGPPSIRTVHQVLLRHRRVGAPPPSEPQPLQRFERSSPNELWQLDHKGPLEIARRKRYPLTILDDHSRYLLAVDPCEDLTFERAWKTLWDVMGDAGLPESILCDNAYAVHQEMPGTLTSFEARLVRLGIHPLHGRPRHPQTQGKVERLHGTYEREMYRHVRLDSDEHFRADALAWRQLYNRTRPHEALGDEPPITRWRPSPRLRPPRLPEAHYDPGAILRRVSSKGDFRFEGNSIVVGEGLAGQDVRVKLDEPGLRVFYCWKQVRVIPKELLTGRRRGHL